MATVRVMFTPSLFFTDKEIEENSGRKVNVQEIIEHPELYILGQTDDSLAEKLSYSECRIEDILSLKNLYEIEKITVKDKVKFFLGKIKFT